jgi:hypothetical protein
MTPACASRADTRPCRLPRMAPASVRVSSYSLSSASRLSRICGSRAATRRSSSLPLSRPSLISLKVFKSLPSKNTASGLTPSSVRNSLADLPMRWVSITSWPEAAISTAGAPCCSLSDEMVSAISSRSEDWRLMVLRAAPTWVSTASWFKTAAALVSARSTIGSNSSIRGSKAGPAASMDNSLSPDFRPRTLRARTVELSFTSPNASGLPTKACETLLARRCDCINA